MGFLLHFSAWLPDSRCPCCMTKKQTNTKVERKYNNHQADTLIGFRFSTNTGMLSRGNKVWWLIEVSKVGGKKDVKMKKIFSSFDDSFRSVWEWVLCAQMPQHTHKNSHEITVRQTAGYPIWVIPEPAFISTFQECSQQSKHPLWISVQLHWHTLSSPHWDPGHLLMGITQRTSPVSAPWNLFWPLRNLRSTN